MYRCILLSHSLFEFLFFGTSFLHKISSHLPKKSTAAQDLNRPDFEVEVYEIASTIAEVRFAISNLRSWMKPESALTPPVLQMGSSRIERIPKGVVFVMGAWNFPFHLSLTPCIAAIAAGNCVVLKPSDVSPASAQQLKELCDKYLDPSAFMTFLGGVEESTELLARKWNHIFYTGNAVIGRVVMTAAAKHLCPVTLELGGGGQKLKQKTWQKIIENGKTENKVEESHLLTIWSIYDCYKSICFVLFTQEIFIFI